MSRRSSAPAPPIDQLTLGHLQAAVEAGVEDSADLDFEERHYDDAEEKRGERAKGRSSARDHIGELLVIGALPDPIAAAMWAFGHPALYRATISSRP